MSPHSHPPRTATPRAPLTNGGFLRAWHELIGTAGVPTIPRRRGRPPRVPLDDLLPALTYHVVQGTGTLAEHFLQLFGTTLADSSWSDRRQRLPWEIFTELMQRVLRPRARRTQAGSFWRDWRLVALDGTQFSLTNTAQVRATRPKARSRRGRAAFAKMTAVVLLELGLHNPLAAAIGRARESEWALAPQLLSQLPARALLLGDRLYGCAAFAAHAWAACQRVGSHFLLRARTPIKTQSIRSLRDGSWLVRVPVHDPRRKSRIVEWLEVREIRVRVGRPGHRTHLLRLWTSLRDSRTAPALELAQLYAQRWEHELYFRDLKHQLRKTAVLQSQTVDTGAQEIAAVVLASAVLAVDRATIAGDDLAALRISFPKLLQVVQAMWFTVAFGDGVVSERQMQTMLKRGYAFLRQCRTPARRSRSCPRKVRQPIKHWPRLMRNQSVEGPFHLEIL
jgi:hypothetical protein